ncbi:MAG: hypothetical protein K2W93_18255, partial [Burkholderiaceae bacterium]|nr:hypothetical protein [Burkholderiaceae bacterium]
VGGTSTDVGRGSDLSFFKELKNLQARRSQTAMAQWGGGERQVLAEAIAEVLAVQLRWKSKVFLPDDAAIAVFHGPSFDFSDPVGAFDAVVELVGRDFGIQVSASFWQSHGDSSMGKLVDALLRSRDV